MRDRERERRGDGGVDGVAAAFARIAAPASQAGADVQTTMPSFDGTPWSGAAADRRALGCDQQRP